jgi:hypothetical protein
MLIECPNEAPCGSDPKVDAGGAGWEISIHVDQKLYLTRPRMRQG